MNVGQWKIPLCARCLGIVIGLPIGIFTATLDICQWRWNGIMFLIPLLIDGGTQEAGYRDSNNVMRAVTGILGGIGMGIFISLWAVEDYNWAKSYI